MTFDDFFEQVNKQIDLSDAYDLTNDNYEEYMTWGGTNYEFGATKLVFIPDREDDLNMVIKIPFAGDEAGDFVGAHRTECGWDYCEQEEFFYNQAVNYGLENFFLETKRIGDIDGWPAYSQERAYWANAKEPTEKSLKRAERIINHWDSCLPMDKNWVAIALDKHGEEKVSKLSKFLRIFQIGDLTTRNIGYDINGDAVLVDYADYNE